MKINRRQFLSVSSATAVGALFPSAFSVGQTKKLGIALLGLGGYSTYQLAPALQLTSYCKLKGIITGSPDKIPQWQEKYGIKDQNCYSYENMHQVANNDEIDVIYVVTPTGTHARYTVAAAATGKHVWCEKPMAMTVTECQQMIDACQQNKVQLTLGYRIQHEPNTKEFNSYANTLPLGRMQSAEAAAGYRGGGGTGWRYQKNMGGGALYDMGVYTVNGLRNALQSEPVEVLSARQFTDRPLLFTEVDETTEYKLRFANGLIAQGKTSVGNNYNHLKINTKKGWYEMSPMQTYTGVEGKRSDGIQLNQPVISQQAIQMDEDAMAILQNQSMIIPPQEGLKDIRVIQAIIQSAANGQPERIG